MTSERPAPRNCEECGQMVSLLFHLKDEDKWVCYDCKEGLTLEREKVKDK